MIDSSVEIKASDEKVVNPPAKPVIQNNCFASVAFIRYAAIPATNTPRIFTIKTPINELPTISIICHLVTEPIIPPSETISRLIKMLALLNYFSGKRYPNCKS